MVKSNKDIMSGVIEDARKVREHVIQNKAISKETIAMLDDLIKELKGLNRLLRKRGEADSS